MPQISIHTSAREVTDFGMMMLWSHQFQSTLPQGKWRWVPLLFCIIRDFNPHFRKGSDGQDIDWTATEDDISIHTSAREVTVRQLLFTMSQNYFNPHFREGSDTIRNKIRLPHLLFQSTLPRGKWQLMMWTRLLICWFQSTLPRGKWLVRWWRKQDRVYFNPHFREGSDK